MGARAPGPEALVLGESGIQREGSGNTRGREVGWSPRTPLVGTRAKERDSCYGDGEASDGGTLTILYAPGNQGGPLQGQMPLLYRSPSILHLEGSVCVKLLVGGQVGKWAVSPCSFLARK